MWVRRRSCGGIILLVNFEKRNENLKILVIGLPKSGTSILTYRIAGSMKKTKVFFEPEGKNGLSNVETHKKLLSSKRKNVVTKCLYYSHKERELERIIQLYDKTVWIIRDPRDRIISGFMYKWNKTHNPDKERFFKVLSLVKKKEKNPSNIDFVSLLDASSHIDTKFIINQVRDLNKLINDLQWLREKIFIIKYEDFVEGKNDLLGEFLKINVNPSADIPEDLNRVKRSGSFGNWRNWFTEKDCLFFRALYYESLLKLGYNADDWDLETNQCIDPAISSEYMESIFKTGKYFNL